MKTLSRLTQFLAIGLSLMALACDDTSLDPVDPAPAVAYVVVSPAALELTVGATAPLNAKAYAQDNTELSRTITWRSSDTTIATVDAAGRVQARRAGTVEIVARSEGKEAKSVLQISTEQPPPQVALVVVSPENVVLYPFSTRQLSVRLYDMNGLELDANAYPKTWASSDTSRLTVDANGVARAKKGGIAFVDVTVSNITARARIEIPSWYELTLARANGNSLPTTVRTIPQPSENPNVEISHLYVLTAMTMRVTTDYRAYEQRATIEVWESVSMGGNTIVSKLRTQVFEDAGTVGQVALTFWFTPNGPGRQFRGFEFSNGFITTQPVINSASEYELEFRYN